MGQSPHGAASTKGRKTLSPSPRGEGLESAITKDAIFAYCCAAVRDPLYREKYALNLKRDFPHIPFMPIFPNGSNGARRCWGCIDLLGRVVAVSVETVAITEAMCAAAR